MPNTQELTRELFEQTLHKLREVCGHRAVLPGSHIFSSGLSELTVIPSHTMHERAEVWKGELSSGSITRMNVCLKAMKIEKVREVCEVLYSIAEAIRRLISQEFHGEVALWVKLNHPNILRCFGVTLDPPRIVIEWTPNGHVMEYLQDNHDADRTRFVSYCLFRQGLVTQYAYPTPVDRRSSRVRVSPFVRGGAWELEAGRSLQDIPCRVASQIL